MKNDRGSGFEVIAHTQAERMPDQPLTGDEGSNDRAPLRVELDGWFCRYILLSILALADPTDWRIGAAPPARRLAPGVGSRVALPRAVAGRVGQAQLEN